MSEHYFSSAPKTKSGKSILMVTLLDRTLKFITDSGVFSKKMIDFGSQELINQVKITSNMTRMIDVGCGYGPLTIALLSAHPQLSALMLDVNTRALALAQENCQLNNCAERVTIQENDGLNNIAFESADIIVTNPPIRAGKEVVHQILRQAHSVLIPTGELWVVIQKKQGMASAKKLMNEVFNHVEIVSKNKGYYILMSKKQ